MSQSQLLTRFAPSPTGYLHLGHVVSAIYTWGVARFFGAKIILRIEDHDRTRSRPEYERAILEDLAWLGFVTNNGVRAVGEGSDFRQSDCDAAYRAAVERLRQRAQVYACDCSRKRLSGPDNSESDGEIAYDGHCRDRGLPLADGYGWRVILPDEEIGFSDLRVGNVRQRPARQCGDLLLRDRLGNWTYQFAVVVDDWRQEVTLVTRGKDLLASTGRQILLSKLLGRVTPPAFYHHPLLIDETGRKLGKRFFSEGIIRRREAGEDPRVILGEAAFAVGLAATPEPIELAAAYQAIGNGNGLHLASRAD